MVCDKMEDVSNKVIFVLVILTVVISVFSTVLMLSASNTSITKNKISEPVSSGKISYNIMDPDVAPVSAAKISYTIEKP
jgi:hypothetical protein